MRREQPDDLGIRIHDRDARRVGRALDFLVRVRAVFEQQRRHLDVPVVDRGVERAAVGRVARLGYWMRILRGPTIQGRSKRLPRTGTRQ